MVTGLDPTAIDCPHPDRLRGRNGTVTVQVNGGRGAMNLCLGCKRMFEALFEGWAQHRVGPRVVVKLMRAAGYTRLDAAKVVLELCTGSLRRLALRGI
jgi:hypothetical protein